MPGNGIFISYRRDDTSGYAGRLYDRLVGTFGGDRVFMDIDTIAPGHEFATDIDKALTNCGACVVLIGRQWVSISDTDGHRRLENPTDFVRLEVATAIRRGVTIFPVLVDRAGAPASAALPDDIRPLAGRQAIELTNERWNYDTGRLLLALQEDLDPEEPPPPPRPVQPKREHPSGAPKRTALIAGGAVLAIVIAVGALFATRSGPEPLPTQTPSSGETGSDQVSPLQGTYAVTMHLDEFSGELAEGNLLWEEPSPTEGAPGDSWSDQKWTFNDGFWRVEGRGVINGKPRPDGSYFSTGTSTCAPDDPNDEAEVTRHLVPTSTGPPGPPAQTFAATLTIHWDCEATGPIDATFSVEGTHTG